MSSRAGAVLLSLALLGGCAPKRATLHAPEGAHVFGVPYAVGEGSVVSGWGGALFALSPDSKGGFALAPVR